MPVRIVVVDDHQLFCECYRSLLASAPDLQIVGEARDAESAYAEIARTRPDVVVLDYVLPGLQGPDACREIVRRYPGIHVLMVSMCREPDRIAYALSCGAVGYVTKEQSSDDLLGAIRAAARDERYVPQVEGVSALERRLRTAPGRRDGVLGALTSRERQVFELAAKGLDNATIARQLLISRRTVETHRCRLMRKLKIRTTGEMALLALRHGLLDLDAPLVPKRASSAELALQI